MSNELKTRVVENTTEIIVQGVTVRLVFAAQKNTDIPLRVRDILKNSFLQRVSA